MNWKYNYELFDNYHKFSAKEARQQNQGTH